jgi:hypothetical protein
MAVDDQLTVEPGRPVAADLLLEAERQQDPDPSTVAAAAEVVRHATIDQVGWGTPVVGVDALHVASAARVTRRRERWQPGDDPA